MTHTLHDATRPHAILDNGCVACWYQIWSCPCPGLEAAYKRATLHILENRQIGHLEKPCRFNNSPLSPQISQCLQTQDVELPIE